MPSVFDYLFNRKAKSTPDPAMQNPLSDLRERQQQGHEGKQEALLGEGQRSALASPKVREALRCGSQESLNGCNRGQMEIDFGRVTSDGLSSGRPLFMDNPEVRDTLKALYENLRMKSEPEPDEEQDFEQLFESDGKNGSRRAARALSGMLRMFEDQCVPKIEYTDPESLSRWVPEILDRGFEAMVLAKSVQGTLRNQVNIWTILETGEEKGEAEARWRRLDVLTGARNAALDICSYFATENFEKGCMPQDGDEEKRRLLVNCVSSLCYVNDPSYRAVEERPLKQITNAQTAYMRRGGDYRAFNEVEDETLCGFLRGEFSKMEVRYRPDFLACREAVYREQREAAKVKIAAADLVKEEFGKDIERSRAYELDQKGRAVHSGRTGVGDHIGKPDRHDAGVRLRSDGGRRL